MTTSNRLFKNNCGIPAAHDPHDISEHHGVSGFRCLGMSLADAKQTSRREILDLLHEGALQAKTENARLERTTRALVQEYHGRS